MTVGSGRPGPVVLCLSQSFGRTSPEALATLESAGAVLVRSVLSDEKIDDRLREAAALIVGTENIDAALLDRAPNLVIVCKHGAGIDNIDVDAATKLGVAVTSAAGANAVAVAELTMGFIIGLARGIVYQDSVVRSGGWGVHIGRSLQGSTLGLVGIGRIGQLVAARAASFEMEVLAHDVVPDPPQGPWQLRSLEELLAESDFVSVHVPLTAETRSLIGAEQLSLIKPTAYLINAARGGIVDGTALGRALADGAIAGAALDVFEEEPPPLGTPFFEMRDRTILTPHMGAFSDRALAATSVVTSKSVVDALGGVLPAEAANNPEQWRGRRA